jgi:hypothetical protein
MGLTLSTLLSKKSRLLLFFRILNYLEALDILLVKNSGNSRNEHFVRLLLFIPAPEFAMIGQE